MRRRLSTFLLGGLLCGASLLGCASTGGVRHKATVSIVSAHAVLSIVDDTEMKLVCGKPTAPQPPLCVTDDAHRRVSQLLVNAYSLETKVARIVRDLPIGAPTPAEVATLTVQIGSLIEEILALIPKSAPKDALVQKITPSEVR